MERKNRGRFPRRRVETSGSGALLVLVDSLGSWWDYSLVEDTILKALDHFGLPYRLRDLAGGPLTAGELSSCSSLVMAQSRLGRRLSPRDCRLISDSVHNGMGLVNCDGDLRPYAGAYLEIWGFHGINAHPGVFKTVRVCDNNHYISALQREGEEHRFERFVSGSLVQGVRSGVRSLLEGFLDKECLVYIRHLMPGSAFEPRNYPLLFAAGWGNGRAVQFCLDPRLWTRRSYGRARGLDDIFFRSIVWTARKPFLANPVPPFATISFDDCCGRYDFAYADMAAEAGWVPMPSLFIRQVPERLYGRIRDQLETGTIAYNTHALDYYTLLSYEFGRGTLSKDKLAGHIAEETVFWERIGADQPETIRNHWGEYGTSYLSRFWETGRRFFDPALQMDIPKQDHCLEEGYWPYNLHTLYYDYLPDDRRFFVFASLLKRGREDFLSGFTVNLGECPRNDLEGAAAHAADAVALGLRSGFFCELLTHEQKFEGLSLDEWKQILHRVDALTEQFGKIKVSHDRIGRYLKGRYDSHIMEVQVKGDTVDYRIEGASQDGLWLSVFTDTDDAVETIREETGGFNDICRSGTRVRRHRKG